MKNYFENNKFFFGPISPRGGYGIIKNFAKDIKYFSIDIEVNTFMSSDY